MKDNIRWLMNIVKKAQRENIPTLLDATNAFDRLEWPYLKGVINSYDFGSNFKKWINMICRVQGAIVIMDRYKTNKIKIE